MWPITFMDVEVGSESNTAYRFRAMADLFVPDFILPEQYQHQREYALHRRGEIRLLYAVLQDAIECFQKGVGAKGRQRLRLAREAEEWIFTDDNRWPFSFLNVCLVLGLHPEYLRNKLIQWREQQLAQVREHRPRSALTSGRPQR